ncbi:hypothetical protein [Streptomyces sp. V1I6]|uniref:hypothetical protein n=1 Tax=Streptomyces sp. V1I6 TaxID=3042273 RepID=UPI002788F29B|nr:hypothetical protein [Streptomyces sp. V1I6]MDQ0847609.1 hypothetical protein [Streptomyces sp. V1I6]
MSIGPERSARVAAMIESARSIWEATHDSNTLQQWLKDHNCHGTDAVFVTMGLLNCGLGDAGRMYFDAPCRQAERDFHNQVMDDLEAAGEDR